MREIFCFTANSAYTHNTMSIQLMFLQRFQPRDLRHAWNVINLFEEIRYAFHIYTHVYSKTLMLHQMKWDEGVLKLEGDIPPIKKLKDIVERLTCKICYHPPMLVDQPDLAREEDQHVFVYLSREKVQKVLLDRCVTFGTELVLATTIQPYRSELSVQEIVRVHNLTAQFSRTEESDLECFIAIFASNLFFQSPELKVTSLYGREIPCTFFIRRGTENRPYDVVACGVTRFANKAMAKPLPPSSPPVPDLTLRLSISGREDNVDDELMKLGPARIKTRRVA